MASWWCSSPDLGRLAVAARLCDRPLDAFRADPRWIVADVYEVVLPVQPHVGYVRLGSQGSHYGVGAASAVHAPELEGAVARGGIVGIGLCGGFWINTTHRAYSSRTLRPLRLHPMLGERRARAYPCGRYEELA